MNKLSKNEPNGIRLGGAIAYGSGDMAFNFFYTGLNLYLLFYYTDVVGIAPATAGLIFMVPVIWDAITDPAMGAIAARTRTRFGQYRPYLIFGAPILCLSFVGMFAAPLWFPGAAALAALLSHLIFRTVYTVVGIPYTALSAVITTDGRERTLLAGARMQFATIGGILTAFLVPVLAGQLGNGDLKLGYLLTSMAFAGTAFIIFAICAATTREPDRTITSETPSLQQSWSFLKNNSPFWLIFCAVFIAALGASVFGKSLVYYVIYNMGQPDLVKLALTLQTLMAGLSVIFWTILGRRFEKKRVWIAGTTLGVTAQASLFLIAPTTAAPLLILVGLNGLAVGAFIVMFWAMLPDTVEYGQWKTGVRDEGTVFGLNQLALKAATGIGVGLLGLILGAIGYQANADQSPDTLENIRKATFLIPVLTGIVSIAIISRYPITASMHRRIVQEIADRQ